VPRSRTANGRRALYVEAGLWKDFAVRDVAVPVPQAVRSNTRRAVPERRRTSRGQQRIAGEPCAPGEPERGSGDVPLLTMVARRRC
jgi:hypothetical protein